jgi:hypothetical protein
MFLEQSNQPANPVAWSRSEVGRAAATASVWWSKMQHLATHILWDPHYCVSSVGSGDGIRYNEGLLRINSPSGDDGTVLLTTVRAKP